MNDAMQKELKEELLKLIKSDPAMSKMFSPAEQGKIVENVVNSLVANNIELTPGHLKDNNVKDGLKIACRTQATQLNNPAYKFECPFLLKYQNELDKKDCEKLLKNIFSDMLKLTPKNKTNPLSEKDVDELSDQLSKTTTDRIPTRDKDDLVVQNPKSSSFFDQLNEASLELYGAFMPGAVSIPVQGIQAGDQMGRSGALANEVGDNEMARISLQGSTENKITSMICDIANLTQSSHFEESLIDEVMPSSYKTPTLTPSGGGGSHG